MPPTPNKPNKEGSEEFDPNYSVMPHNLRGDMDFAQQEPAPAQNQNNDQAFETDQPAYQHGHSIRHSRATYWLVGFLILVALGAMAYFLLGSGFGNKQANSVTVSSNSQLPTIFLKVNFQVEKCEDLAICGDSADPDNDGLTNLEEFRKQTNPKKNDSDEDGLADGDEVMIYLTQPNKKFTDSRTIAIEMGYHDGSQIKNGFDPLTPNLKMTEVRLKQIEADKEKYGLHEPTISTLAAQPEPAPKTVNVMVSNNKFSQSPITVKRGDTVVWVNQDTINHQIASDPHPQHTDLPDLESGSLATNQTYSYKFMNPGTYNYHDHLNPTVKGTIIVE